MDVQPAHLNRDSFRDSLKGLLALEIINDLSIGFPINIIISLSMQQMSHAKGPSQDNHAVDPLHGLMTFFPWYTFFLNEQIIGISSTTAWRLNSEKLPPADSGPCAGGQF